MLVIARKQRIHFGINKAVGYGFLIALINQACAQAIYRHTGLSAGCQLQRHTASDIRDLIVAIQAYYFFDEIFFNTDIKAGTRWRNLPTIFNRFNLHAKRGKHPQHIGIWHANTQQ